MVFILGETMTLLIHSEFNWPLLLPNFKIQNQIFFRPVCRTHCAMLPPSYQQSCFSVNQFTANLAKKSTKKVSSLHLQDFLSLAITQNGKKISKCVKVIYTKYSKHWLYTVAHTIDCVCSKINNSWFNPWFSFYFSSLCPAPYIEWYMC